MIPLSQQLEELILIRSSLLPGERLILLNASPSGPSDNPAMTWEKLVDEGMVTNTEELENFPPANFRVGVDGVDILLDIDCQGYNGDCTTINDCISISGTSMSRIVQETWRKIVIEGLKGVAEEGGDFPLYQLLSLHLLPLLHEEPQRGATSATSSGEQTTQIVSSTPYHVLFTSHHLISTTKRRNMSGWSSKLQISGFAKIGYPGVIYAEGSKESIEEFADNIKAMQWLALKKRFVEPLESTTIRDSGYQLSGWREFEKVGEVVEEMRRLGRGEYVLEMGIGGGAKE